MRDVGGEFRFLSRRTSEIELSEATARAFRAARVAVGWTQARLAGRAEVSRSLISKIEVGHRAVSYASVARVADALGLRLELVIRAPHLVGERPRDLLHARVCTYVERELRRPGWEVAREVPVGGARPRGWIDIVAYHPPTKAFLMIEVKTEIRDIGEIERKLAWYEAAAPEIARGRGWTSPARISSALVVLDTRSVRAVVEEARSVFRLGFPTSAARFAAWIGQPVSPAPTGRAIALVDPSSRRRSWLRGIRAAELSDAPYVDYADAARRLSTTRSSRSAPGSSGRRGRPPSHDRLTEPVVGAPGPHRR